MILIIALSVIGGRQVFLYCLVITGSVAVGVVLGRLIGKELTSLFIILVLIAVVNIPFVSKALYTKK